MSAKKLLLALASLLCLALAWIRPAWEVEVGGAPLGVWTGAEIAGASSAARAAAAEIRRGGGEDAVPETRFTLAFARGGRSAAPLARALLAASGGVQRCWDVSVGGVDAGRVGDASALGEALMAAIAEAAPPDSLRTGFEREVGLSEVFVAAGSFDNVMDVSRRVRELTRVSYVSPEGETFYA